jgi:hypothetical protein
LTSSPPWKGEDSSRDLRSRCRFAVHSRALVRKKAPRAATACPAAFRAGYCVLPAWLSRTRQGYRTISIFNSKHAVRAFLHGLKVGASARRHW